MSTIRRSHSGVDEVRFGVQDSNTSRSTTQHRLQRARILHQCQSLLHPVNPLVSLNTYADTLSSHALPAQATHQRRASMVRRNDFMPHPTPAPAGLNLDLDVQHLPNVSIHFTLKGNIKLTHSHLQILLRVIQTRATNRYTTKLLPPTTSTSTSVVADAMVSLPSQFINLSGR